MSIDYPVALVGGAVIALLLGLFGGGGSVLATPLLLYGVGVRDPHVAIGTAAAAVSINAAANLYGQARAGVVKWPCALVFGLSGLAGSLAGAHVAKQMDGTRLLAWFALAMLLIGLSMLRPRATTGDAMVQLDRALTLRLMPLGLLVGLAAGFFGIGGGFLIVPGLMAATGMTLANAAASSLVSVVLFGAATSSSYAASGLIDLRVLAVMVAGGVVGAFAAMRLAPRLAGHALLAQRLFAAMVIATAVYVGWRALRG